MKSLTFIPRCWPFGEFSLLLSAASPRSLQFRCMSRRKTKVKLPSARGCSTKVARGECSRTASCWGKLRARIQMVSKHRIASFLLSPILFFQHICRPLPRWNESRASWDVRPADQRSQQWLGHFPLGNGCVSFNSFLTIVRSFLICCSLPRAQAGSSAFR